MTAAAKQAVGRLSPIPMSDEEFDQISRIVYEHSGIALPRGKRSLLAARLQPLVRQLGYEDFKSYHDEVLGQPTADDLGRLIDRIATNYTYFYRENEHFRCLREEVLPAWTERLERRDDRDLRLWCAAASTGEEPYTIMLELLRYFGDRYAKWQAGLLATDISTTALATARRGRYSRQQLERVPPALERRYFKTVGPDQFELTAEVRREVVFRRLNLQRTQYPFRRPFHAVFCRNVMLYFDEPTRARLEQRLHGVIADDGYLFTSMTEGLVTGGRWFDKLQSGVYRKRGRS